MNKKNLEILDIYWFKERAMQISGNGRKPKGIREWAKCFWNADIFFGQIPAIKTIAIISWLIAWGF